jgi:hypothetical protein
VEGFVNWMQNDLLHWLEVAVFVCFFICVCVLLPMYFFKKFRASVGTALVYFSYLTGSGCWVFSFIVTYRTLGTVWLVVGVLLAGIGVFPLALVGVIIHGLWSTIPDLLFAIALMLIPRFVGLRIVERQSRIG